MDSRREFIKKAALLAGSTGLHYALPASIRKALTINPPPGSTYLDAEHIVFLMQENRSFDHCFGTLQGVRGFNDPRAIHQPDGNLVWMQSNEAGETYAPFHLDLKNTKATWMSSLPHAWTNQVDARNEGNYDKWLDVKRPGHYEYRHMPLTMGYYTREDIPFYYALADAFTVCDQHFCSSLTGTTPNRLFFWSGTIRPGPHEHAKAHVWNEDADYETMVNWKTYPERLEENGVSWKVYQNDLSVPGGYTGEQDAWMANFGDNPLEYFTQYHVKHTERYGRYLQQLKALPGEISALENELQKASSKDAATITKTLEEKKKVLFRVREDAEAYTKEKYEALSAHEKTLHEKAFAANHDDPLFYRLTKLTYTDEGTEREVLLPEGDILHGFRQDVQEGKLPTVSWLVAPENFSDHPSSAWYGAWYISEVLDILTKNPAVWKKTIFVLTYDENDGYFDHVPPFVAPNPAHAATGSTSAGIDARTEFVSMEQEKRRAGSPQAHLRESPVGLGYRVPMVVASPWSRGGWVNSQVFDHTSSLQFLELFLEHKTSKKIIETNISPWRRAVCGNLTSLFRPYDNSTILYPEFIARNAFIESIHQAKFKQLPTAYKRLNSEEIRLINKTPHTSPLMPKQESGTRPSCALPYELYVDGTADLENKEMIIGFHAGTANFGSKASGAPFTVYASGGFMQKTGRVRSYAVAPGERVAGVWKMEDFEGGQYHLQVHGPNGFYRAFAGNAGNPLLHITSGYQLGNMTLLFINKNPVVGYTVEITDNTYKTARQTYTIGPAAAKNASVLAVIPATGSAGWYDVSVQVPGNPLFQNRYAGRVETGKPGTSDPAMGFPGI